MELKPEELKEHGFILLDSLDHQQLIPFVQKYIKKNTTISWSYTIINIFFFSSIVYWIWSCIYIENIKFLDCFSYLSFGIFFVFLLIPIHEYIHVLAYKSQGAQQTSYDVNWKKFYFMALAHQFIADKTEFHIVALAPFVVITTILGLLLLLVNGLWHFTILGTLLMHTAACSGDFGILSYFYFHKEKDLVTYDDIENKISYFYGKPKS
jgi:Putative zincin peptidase